MYMIDGEKPTGAMVALIPSDTDREYCCMEHEGGEPNEVLHVTLKYLGKADEFDDEAREALKSTVEALARKTPAIPMDVDHVEMFGEDNDAVALAFRSPAAEQLHKTIHAITPDIELKWPEYRPHLTLKYVHDEPAPDIDALGDTLNDTRMTADKIRVCFGEDITDFPLRAAEYEEDDDDEYDLDTIVASASALVAAYEAKRTSPDELTEAEIQQRRDAALKSAEARRKKVTADYEAKSKNASARTRGDLEFSIRNQIEKSIREYRQALKNPDLSREQRIMVETALQIELENKREMRIKQAEMKQKLRKELAMARAEYAQAERVFDVDKMNSLRADVERLEKEAEDMQLGSEIAQISLDSALEAEREAARVAAEARREQEKRLKDFYRGLEKAAKERERAGKRAESERKRGERKAESERKKREREAKKKKKEPRDILTPEEKRRLLARE